MYHMRKNLVDYFMGIMQNGGLYYIFDLTAKVSYKCVPNCYHHLVRVCGNIPIDWCGNKIDAIKRKPKIK